MRIFGQVILHELERFVAVPVGVLDIEDLDARTLDHILEALDALVIDHGRDAAHHHHVALAAELVDHELGRVGADRDVVARHIEVLDGRIGEAAVHHRDEGAGLLHRGHRRGQLLG